MRACAGDAKGLKRIAFAAGLTVTDGRRRLRRSLAGLVDEFDSGRRGSPRDGARYGVDGAGPDVIRGLAAGHARSAARTVTAGGGAARGGEAWARGNVAFDQGQQVRDVPRRCQWQPENGSGSSAGTQSMTVSRVSVVVPWPGSGATVELPP